MTSSSAQASPDSATALEVLTFGRSGVDVYPQQIGVGREDVLQTLPSELPTAAPDAHRLVSSVAEISDVRGYDPGRVGESASCRSRSTTQHRRQ